MTKEELIKRLAKQMYFNRYGDCDWAGDDETLYQDLARELLPIFSEFIENFELQSPESAKDDYRIGILAGYYQFRTAIKAELERYWRGIGEGSMKGIPGYSATSL